MTNVLWSLHYVLAMYCVSDDSYFNKLNSYDDTEGERDLEEEERQQ